MDSPLSSGWTESLSRDTKPGITFSVAPMMDITDRHCRSFHRVLSRRAVLYTEMITADAIIHGDRNQLLEFESSESPVVLQLGGSDPSSMAECAAIGEQFGYDSVNINVGCPSDRVKSGRFGACLMAEPDLVAECVEAMRASVNIPVTVKCRIGIDREDSFAPFEKFIHTVAQSGCRTFIVHARKAWLDGLSPKENRNIPPLRYDFVERIQSQYPDYEFVLNGGLVDHQRALDLGKNLNGVMMGREVCSDPWLLTSVDTLYYGDPPDSRSRYQAVEEMFPYIEQQLSRGVALGRLVKPMLGLFRAQPGGRLWRRALSETMWLESAGLHTVKHALKSVRQVAEQQSDDQLRTADNEFTSNIRSCSPGRVSGALDDS